MKRLSLLSLIILAVQPAYAMQESTETKTIVDPTLMQQLRRIFPGYRLANVHDYAGIEREPTLYPDYLTVRWSYGAIKDDFNGDGLADYTMIIHHRGHYLWIVALKLEDTYWIRNFGEPFIEDVAEPSGYEEGKMNLVMGTGPAAGLYQEVFYDFTRPGFDYSALETFKVPFNPFSYIQLQGSGGTFRAYWKDGKWIQERILP